MKRASAPLTIDRDGYHLHGRAVPAWVCGQCGQAYFETEDLKHVESAVQSIDRETREMDAATLTRD